MFVCLAATKYVRPVSVSSVARTGVHRRQRFHVGDATADFVFRAFVQDQIAH
jgi:hypothetical protein